MKNILFIAVCTLMSFNSWAVISTSASATSNYVWRGQTQTTNNAAIQGSVTYESDLGLSIGSWVSNITDDTEADFYANYSHSFSDNFSMSAGYLYYHYLQAKGIDTSEFSLSLNLYGLDFLTSYTDDFFGTKSSALYFLAGYGFTLSAKENLSLSLNVGYSKYDNETLAGTTNYLDYKVALVKTFEKFEMNIGYTNTDRKDRNDQTFSVMLTLNL